MTCNFFFVGNQESELMNSFENQEGLTHADCVVGPTNSESTTKDICHFLSSTYMEGEKLAGENVA